MTDRAWVADPGIGWRILLTARLAVPLAPAAAGSALRALCHEHDWDPAEPVVGDELTSVRAELAAPHPAPVRVGLAGPELVVSAHHSAADGLGLLEVLSSLTGAPVSSDARGAGRRPPGAGLARTVGRRLTEVALHPPAPVTSPSPPQPARGDVLVEGDAPPGLRTADLVQAAAGAVVAHQQAVGRRARHVAIAIGVGAPAGPGDRIGDRSGLIRLRDVERLDLAAIREAVRNAPLETPPGGGRERPVLDRLATTGLRVLAPRLGSSMLVSHLGEVTADQAERLAFHPVTAGGSGISLGAVGHRGRTTITLRARATRWSEDGLQELLEAVLVRLRR
ncbi:hypothetical protein [Nocardioides panacisoli]|uniref:O-acyltransferase WSD1 C-terminal domain-containing protein n=1 Tax=Nocardioides panacisoli TaxID=627624 RepID=A0ABP7IMG1_9ACTN